MTAAADEVKTSRATPTRRQAAITFSVPRTLTVWRRLSWNGPLRVSTSPATWKHTLVGGGRKDVKISSRTTGLNGVPRYSHQY